MNSPLIFIAVLEHEDCVAVKAIIWKDFWRTALFEILKILAFTWCDEENPYHRIDEEPKEQQQIVIWDKTVTRGAPTEHLLIAFVCFSPFDLFLLSCQEYCLPQKRVVVSYFGLTWLHLRSGLWGRGIWTMSTPFQPRIQSIGENLNYLVFWCIQTKSTEPLDREKETISLGVWHVLVPGKV